MKDKSKNVCNPKVFESIFNDYAEEIKRFLYFKFGDLETAEDIMQDAFVKLWQKCETIKYKSVKNLLYTIANNLFLNVKKHEKIILNNQQFLVKGDNYESPEFLLEEQEFLIKIEKVIDSLTPKQREVFLLSRMEGKKYKEIALSLDISVKAVEKRMQKALLVVREKIGNV